MDRRFKHQTKKIYEDEYTDIIQIALNHMEKFKYRKINFTRESISCNYKSDFQAKIEDQHYFLSCYVSRCSLIFCIGIVNSDCSRSILSNMNRFASPSRPNIVSTPLSFKALATAE